MTDRAGERVQAQHEHLRLRGQSGEQPGGVVRLPQRGGGEPILKEPLASGAWRWLHPSEQRGSAALSLSDRAEVSCAELVSLRGLVTKSDLLEGPSVLYTVWLSGYYEATDLNLEHIL